MQVKLEKTITGHKGPIYDACYDGAHFLYSTAADHFVTRWYIETGKQDSFAIKLAEASYCICLINENTFLLIGTTSGKLHLIDLFTKQEIKCLDYHKVALFSCVEMKTQDYFILGDADGNISIWNKQTFQLALSIPLNAGKIRMISFDKDEKRMLIACQDGSIRVFETQFFNEISIFQAHKNGCNVAIFDSKNPEMIISGGKDAHIKVWNLKTSLLVKSFPAHHETIYSIRSTHNCILSSSRDKKIKIWANDTFLPLNRIDGKLSGHSRSVNGLKILDFIRFFSYSDDASIKIWSIL
jgi:WD40 repeat protein